MGRNPSPPGSRARRNPGQAEWQPIEGATVPKWPGTTSDPAEARTYWRTVWRELGGMWTEADKMPLFRSAMLHASVIASGRKKGLASRLGEIARAQSDESMAEFLEQLASDFAFGGADAGAAKELRELEDRLGISPLSRRRLQWELTTGTGKSDPAAAAPATDAARERRTPTGNVLSALA